MGFDDGRRVQTANIAAGECTASANTIDDFIIHIHGKMTFSISGISDETRRQERMFLTTEGARRQQIFTQAALNEQTLGEGGQSGVRVAHRLNSGVGG